MSWEWTDNAFQNLPGTKDELFDSLWVKKRLLFDKSIIAIDKVDEQSARLIGAALIRKLSLLVVLPDAAPRRPALLLATALLRTWWQSRKNSTQKLRPILYFGSTVGIREHLARTTVKGLSIDLAEEFQQVDVSRHAGSPETPSPTVRASYGLPKLITFYAPADPVTVIDAYRPSWIALDVGDAASLPWLPPLLERAQQLNLPVLAWGHNPMSVCVVNFADRGLGFGRK